MTKKKTKRNRKVVCCPKCGQPRFKKTSMEDQYITGSYYDAKFCKECGYEEAI